MTPAPTRWGVQVVNERGGHSRRLPDLAYRLASDGTLHVAVVVIRGHSNPRRERAALEGWQRSVLAGQYAQVRYLPGPFAAGHFSRLATELGLTRSEFIAAEHVMADEPPLPTSLPANPARGLRPPRRRQPPLPISCGLRRSTRSGSGQAPRSPR